MWLHRMLATTLAHSSVRSACISCRIFACDAKPTRTFSPRFPAPTVQTRSYLAEHSDFCTNYCIIDTFAECPNVISFCRINASIENNSCRKRLFAQVCDFVRNIFVVVPHLWYKSFVTLVVSLFRSTFGILFLDLPASPTPATSCSILALNNCPVSISRLIDKCRRANFQLIDCTFEFCFNSFINLLIFFLHLL